MPTSINHRGRERDPNDMNIPRNDAQVSSFHPIHRGNQPKQAQEQEPVRSGRPKPRKNSIFDRLTDHRYYTGTHQHRFDYEGKGRGKEGR